MADLRRTPFRVAYAMPNNFKLQLTDDCILWRLDSRQFPLHHAFRRPRGTIPLRIGDGPAQKQRLVPGGERTIITRIEFVLRGRLRGKRGGSEQRQRCESGSNHARDTTSGPAKEKGPADRSTGPSLFSFERAYASSNSSSLMTGPESWPLASVSRSTNSITAIGAASLARKPALITRV